MALAGLAIILSTVSGLTVVYILRGFGPEAPAIIVCAAVIIGLSLVGVIGG